MDAETQAAIEQLAARLEAMVNDLARQVRWATMQHDREWKDAAAWRTQWSAELDAVEVQIAILTDELHDLRQRLEGHQHGRKNAKKDSRRRPDEND